MVELFYTINTQPFSILDFKHPAYNVQVTIENAAELLATLILMDVEECANVRATIIAHGGNTALYSFDFKPMANKYGIPRRYPEIIVCWKMFEEMYAQMLAVRSRLDDRI